MIPMRSPTVLVGRLGFMAVSSAHASVSCAGVDPLQSLWGRQDEGTDINQVLIDVRSGRSRVLVVRGDAGIGKTALGRAIRSHDEEFRLGDWVRDAFGVQEHAASGGQGAYKVEADGVEPLGRRVDTATSDGRADVR